MKIIKYKQEWDNHKSVNYLLLNTESNEVAGSCFVEEQKNDYYSLNSLYIQPPYRKNNLAHLLTRTVLEDFGTVDLWLKVRRNNDVAIKLYETYGWLLEDVEGNDDVYVWMKREGTK